MANHRKMAMMQAIIALLQCGWSHRRIARELGLHRETVGRYDRERGQNRPFRTPDRKWPITFTDRPLVALRDGRAHANPTPTSSDRRSMSGLTTQRISQDLRTDTG